MKGKSWILHTQWDCIIAEEIQTQGSQIFYNILQTYMTSASEGEETNLPSATEGDTISIFQDCLLSKYPPEHISEQRSIVPLFTKHVETQNTHGRLVTQFIQRVTTSIRFQKKIKQNLTCLNTNMSIRVCIISLHFILL